MRFQRSATAVFLSLVTVVIVLFSTPLRANDEGYSYALIVRLSHVDGDVQIVRGDQSKWEPAVANMPVQQGSRSARMKAARRLNWKTAARSGSPIIAYCNSPNLRFPMAAALRMPSSPPARDEMGQAQLQSSSGFGTTNGTNSSSATSNSHSSAGSGGRPKQSRTNQSSAHEEGGVNHE